MSERTVWRWLAQAEAEPRTAERPVDRFEVTSEVRVLLAYWRGNASAVHRQLVARARTAAGEPAVAVPGGASAETVPVLDPVLSLSTFLHVVRRDLTAGERAGLTRGRRRPGPTMCSGVARGSGATTPVSRGRWWSTRTENCCAPG